MAVSLLPVSALAEGESADTAPGITAESGTESNGTDVQVTVNAHTAFFHTTKMYSYTGGTKGTTDYLAGVTRDDNNTYACSVPAAGDYILEGYYGDADQFMGSVVVTVAAGAANSFSLYGATGIQASNSGWVQDADYTIGLTVAAQDKTPRTIAAGQVTRWGTTAMSCICLSGDTITAAFTPDAGKHPDYLPASKCETMTSNESGFSANCQQFVAVTFTAPENSTVSVGTLASYYVYTFADPTAPAVTADGKVSVTYDLSKDTTYFYRVQNPSGVTYWNYANWSAAAAVDVTAADLCIGSSDFTAKTVISDYSKNIYDRADIYLNINAAGYKNMNVGDTFELNSFRNWFAIDSFMNAKVALPDMHYQVIDPSGSASDVVTVTPNANNSDVAVMKANKAGTAIVLVTYDAMTDMVGQSSTASKQFSAIWPECTGVFVVTVGADGTGIKANMNIDRLSESSSIDAEHDILFYTGTAGANYSFTPEAGCTVTVARSTVDSAMTFSGFTSDGVTTDSTGKVTVTGLTTGRHIIKVEKNGVANYQVVTARGVSYKLLDADGKELTDTTKIKAGDTVQFQFTNLVNPKEKLSGAYNYHASLYYKGEDGTFYESNPGSPYGVYDFSGNPKRQLISITIPKYWAGSSYTLSGCIKMGGFGGVPTHRGITYATGTNPGFSAPEQKMILGQLPGLTIPLAKTTFLKGTLNFKDQNGIALDRKKLTVTLKDAAGNSLTVNDDGTFSAYAETYTYTVSGAGVAYKTGSVTMTKDGDSFDVVLQTTSGSAWDGATLTEPAKDAGGVYQIGTGAELAWFSAQSKADKADLSGKLTADIDLGGYPWNNTIDSANRATVLDGDGHAVTGLNAQRGLFGALGANSKISGLTIRGASAGGGAVTGYASGSGAVIENCTSYVTVSGTGSMVGGIAGYAADGVTIQNCANHGAVSGSESVGGIIGGFVGKASVTGCCNTGTVTATGKKAGGIFGSTGYGVNVTNCYNKGAVTGADCVGGVGGELSASSYGSDTASCSNCYNAGRVAATGTDGTARALIAAVAAAKTAVTNCYYLNTLPTDPCAEALSDADLCSADLGSEFKLICSDYPALTWQADVTEHKAAGTGTVVAPTCTDKGYTICTCSLCGKNYKTAYTAALGHDWCTHATAEECANSGDCVYTAPTCTQPGSIVRTCKRCHSATKTDVIPATGHTVGTDVIVYPACKTYTCPVCKQLVKEWNDARLEHMTLPTQNASGITMTDTGSYPWTYNTEKTRFESTNEGVDKSASQSSLTFTLTNGGKLAFSYGASSESGYDKVNITLANGTDTVKIADGISGTATGSFENTLAAGIYTLSLSFTKDEASAENDDLAYVSGLTLTAFTQAELTDQAAAKTVIDKINAIGTVTLQSAGGIAAARNAYVLLTAAQRKLVDNYALLTAAETELARLQEGSSGPSGNQITVTFRLIGSTKSTQEADLSEGVPAGYYGAAYQTWVKTTSYTLTSGSTVYDLFIKAMNSAGLQYDGADSNYVSAVCAPAALGGYKLAEMTNGPRSGWMYTVNGTHPGYGLKNQTLSDSDTVIWHYVDDYSYEVQDWFADASHPSLGSAATWNRWLEAADANPTSGTSGTSGGTASTASGGSSAAAPGTVIRQEAVVNGGTATVTIPDKSIPSAISAANQAGAKEVTLVAADTGNAEKLNVALSKSSAQEIVDNKNTALQIETALGHVTIPHDALSSMTSQAAGSDLIVSVQKKTASDITDKSIDTTGAVIASVTVSSNSKNITTFGGSALSVDIAVGSGYTEGVSYKTVIISADGKSEAAVGKCVKKDGVLYVEVSTTHLSTFVVTNQRAMAFSDVAEGAWYYDAVKYVYEKGLFSGTSAETFTPSAPMTRAMLVTVLYRLAGSPAVSGTGTFADVDSGKYYASAVLWANQNKIVNGTTATTFTPNSSITREQMAAILYRYAQYKGYDTAKTADLSAFADAGSISGYAQEAMRWANGSGLINGISAAVLNPAGTASRAQVASILMRFGGNTAK